MAIRIGIFDHLDRRDDDLTRFYRERLQLIAAADEAGFHGYHVAEHHFTPIGMAPSPGLFLAAVAQHTTALRFGPMVYTLPFYNPLRLIEEVCMLDHMSGGRLDLGVGRGVSPFESGFFGIDVAESGFRFVEALSVLLDGMTSERLLHRGDYYRVNAVPMEFRPLQKPYPPLWYGLATDRGRVVAAENGMNVMMLGRTERIKTEVALYREAWEEHAGTPVRAASPVGEPIIGVSRHFLVAETEAEAERAARPAYERWYRSLTHLSGTFGFRQLPAIGDFDEARRAGTLVVGAPDAVRAELAGQVAECGFDYLVLQLAFGSLSHQQQMNSLALFTAEVMPALTAGSD